MKLTASQQKIVDRMMAENLIIEVNHGLGIGAKTRVVLVTTDVNLVPNSTIPYGTFESLSNKGVITKFRSDFGGMTRYYYKLT